MAAGIGRALAVAAALFVSSGALAQEFPQRPVRLITGSPGGTSDFSARYIAQKLGERWRQQVVVDNRAGGGGTIGAETTVRSAPDGYTIAMVSGSYGANAALSKIPYDPINDITPAHVEPELETEKRTRGRSDHVLTQNADVHDSVAVS